MRSLFHAPIILNTEKEILSSHKMEVKVNR